ncbi:hypothetical protein TNCV_1290211 [Trichonephila clavipes]|nr:hypothetical protein TNCV_1290211 [Trichonephila clavipes]
MNQENLDKMILLLWVCFTIRFLFFSYWDILILPPILILIDTARFHNTQDQEHLSGVTNPEARDRHTQDSKVKDQRKHFTSLDILVQIMIQEELQRIRNRAATSK